MNGMPPQLANALMSHFSIGRLRLVSGGKRTNVYSGSRSGSWLALKIYNDEILFTREREVLSRLCQTNAPVPRLIDAANLEGKYVLVLDWVDGENLLQISPHFAESEKRAVLENCGRLLGRLHMESVQAELAGATFWKRAANQNWSPSLWQSIIRQRLDKWLSVLLVNYSETSSVALAARCIRNFISVVRPIDKAYIVHCDYSFRNILYASGPQMPAIIIDFEASLIGDPAYDLGKLTWLNIDFHDHYRQQVFIDGWSMETGWSVDPYELLFYQGVHAIAAISWTSEAATRNRANDEFRSRATRTLMAVCESLKRDRRKH